MTMRRLIGCVLAGSIVMTMLYSSMFLRDIIPIMMAEDTKYASDFVGGQGQGQGKGQGQGQGQGQGNGGDDTNSLSRQEQPSTSSLRQREVIINEERKSLSTEQGNIPINASTNVSSLLSTTIDILHPSSKQEEQPTAYSLQQEEPNDGHNFSKSLNTEQGSKAFNASTNVSFSLSTTRDILHPSSNEQEDQPTTGQNVSTSEHTFKHDNATTTISSLLPSSSSASKFILHPLDSIDVSTWRDIKMAQYNLTNTERNILESLDDKRDFKRYDRVAIVTKVLWVKDIQRLRTMLTLVKAAYNRFVNYDIVIFTTLPWTQDEVNYLAKAVAPAKLTVAVEAPPLEAQLSIMPDEELEHLKVRCNPKKKRGVDYNDTKELNLTWFHHCKEGNPRQRVNLAYSWQSEFRAFHIWRHEALKPYKYMIWFDTDAYNSQTWVNDPMEAMVQHNLTVLYEAVYGKTTVERFRTIQEKIYGNALCVNMHQNGTLLSRFCSEEWPNMSFRQIYGFMHITNLDVYRSDTHIRFLNEMVGEYRFARRWDDQLAVAIIAAREDPNRAWRLRDHNFTLNVNHHGLYDGLDRRRIYNNKAIWWNTLIKGNWTAGTLLTEYCKCPPG